MELQGRSTSSGGLTWVGTKRQHGPVVPKPPALPPGVEVGEFFSGAQTPLIWLSVPWFSLRTLDFKVLRNHVTSFS